MRCADRRGRGKLLQIVRRTCNPVPAAAQKFGFNPVIALVLSIVPGVGHIYRGRPFKGIMWFFFVSIAYGMGAPFGLLIHMICAANAAFSGTLREDMLAR